MHVLVVFMRQCIFLVHKKCAHKAGSLAKPERGEPLLEELTPRIPVFSMYMSEKKYHLLARHAYAVVRDPREHVLSQYFHCAESHEHGKR